MILPPNATVVVADGEHLHVFRQVGGGAIHLEPQPTPAIDDHNRDSGGRHQSSAANPARGQLAEDARAAGLADWINAEVTAGRITGLVVIAAPRTLGELRHHYASGTQGALLAEIAKDLANHDLKGITQALQDA